MAKITEKERQEFLKKRKKADAAGLFEMYGKDGKKQGTAKNPPKRGKST